MIYEFPQAADPIRQGDIFQTIPQVHYDPEKLITVDPETEAFNEPRSWIEELNTGEARIISRVEPAYGVVITQDCDTERDDFIAFFKIDGFLKVTKMKIQAKNPIKSWVSIITKHGRVAEKWIYLPPDEQIGFSEQMAADFQTIIPVPTDFLVKNLGRLRIGRLNDDADEHFREKIAQYFRRYPYDEWYPLNKEEFDYYRSDPSREDTPPFPWQE